MIKKIEWKCEILESSSASHVKRYKVIGGWILIHQTITTKGNISESSVFVPDRDHLWIIAVPFDPSDTGKSKPSVNAEDFKASK